jgi:hypothetical protein
MDGYTDVQRMRFRMEEIVLYAETDKKARELIQSSLRKTTQLGCVDVDGLHSPEN